MKNAILVLSLGLALMAGGFSTDASAADRLAGSQWGPGYPEKQFIRFEADDKVMGNGGCNRFFGAYEAQPDGTIGIGPLASTKMACPDEIMQKEAGFVRALEAAASYNRETGQLTLFDAEGAELVVLRHLDWD